MAKTIVLAFFLTLFLSTASSADNRCTGPVMLSRFHDAYLSLISETGQTRRSSAKALLVIVGDKNARAMARQIRKSGQSIDEKKLLDTMKAASEFARQVLTDGPVPDDTFQHGRNVDWLGNVFIQTGCRDHLAAMVTSAEPSQHQQQSREKQSTAPKSKQEQFLIFLAQFLGAVLLLTSIGFGVIKYRHSLTYRKRVVERMPRQPVKFDLEMMYTDPAGELKQAKVSALDISAGGMKVDWPDNNAAAGIMVTVDTPVGQRMATVMWSNAYYAGIMFEKMLSRKELDAIISGEPPGK